MRKRIRSKAQDTQLGRAIKGRLNPVNISWPKFFFVMTQYQYVIDASSMIHQHVCDIKTTFQRHFTDVPITFYLHLTDNSPTFYQRFIDTFPTFYQHWLIFYLRFIDTSLTFCNISSILYQISDDYLMTVIDALMTITRHVNDHFTTINDFAFIFYLLHFFGSFFLSRSLLSSPAQLAYGLLQTGCTSFIPHLYLNDRDR